MTVAGRVQGWRPARCVLGMLVVAAIVIGCRQGSADLPTGEQWPSFTGTYEVREFSAGSLSSSRQETLEFFHVDRWELTAGDTKVASMDGSVYCQWQQDPVETSRCRAVEEPMAPGFWLQPAWPTLIPGDVDEEWQVERDGELHVARLVVERPYGETLRPDSAMDMTRLVRNEYVVRFDEFGIPHSWHEKVDGSTTFEAEFLELVVEETS